MLDSDPRATTQVVPTRSTDTAIQRDPKIEWVTLVEAGRRRLLGNYVLFGLMRILRLKNSLAAPLVLLVLLTIVIHVSTSLLSVLVNGPAYSTAFFQKSSVFLSIFSAYAIVMAGVLYQRTIVDQSDEIARSFATDAGLTALNKWFERFLGFRSQLLAAGTTAGLALITVVAIEVYGGTSIWVGDYLQVCIGASAAGYGWHCGRVVPVLAEIGSKHPVNLFWLNPADSPWIKVVTSAAARASLAGAVAISLAIGAAVFMTRLETAFIAVAISAVWLGVGMLALLYLLLSTTLRLSSSISEKKRESRTFLRGKLDAYNGPLDRLGERDVREVSELVLLYSQVTAAKESVITVRGVQSFVFSLAIPTISFVGGLFKLL